jgi:hypothetical protein
MREFGFLPLVRDFQFSPSQYNQVFLAEDYFDRAILDLVGDYVDALIGSQAKDE